MRLIEELRAFKSYNAQEARDVDILLSCLQTHDDIFTRENPLFHMTASAWVVNARRDRVLMAYHNIYRSWSWLGGHADGDTELLNVAMREVREESGVQNVRPLSTAPYSVEVLPVAGHEKRGKYVCSHLHLNVTYLLEADECDLLSVKADENSGVRWLTLEETETLPTEPWMIERIYKKLNDKLASFTVFS